MSASVRTRTLSAIAFEIGRDWKKPYFGAVPYIDAMGTLDRIEDQYIAEDGGAIVIGFLANANTWRGETAKRVKAELKAMLKAAGR
jgi:hypothetical protein